MNDAGERAEATFRTLEEKDVAEAARIVAGIWWPEARSGEERVLMGTWDLADYARRATFSEVACANGHVVGIVLARAGNPDATRSRCWQARRDRARAGIRALNPALAQAAERAIAAEARIDEALLAASGCDERFELVLFAVEPGARGLGVGGALIADAERYLASRGARTYFLYTDTGCTWGFYEHRGLRRCATHAASADEQAAGLCEEYYVYEGAPKQG